MFRNVNTPLASGDAELANTRAYSQSSFSDSFVGRSSRTIVSASSGGRLPSHSGAFDGSINIFPLIDPSALVVNSTPVTSAPLMLTRLGSETAKVGIVGVVGFDVTSCAITSYSPSPRPLNENPRAPIGWYVVASGAWLPTGTTDIETPFEPNSF